MLSVRPRRVLTAILAVLAALCISAPAALADSQIRISGASASFQSYGEKFRIWDTACDNDSVYVLYQRGFSTERRINFTDGCNLMGLFDRSFAEHQSIRYKVCVNIPFGTDRCSGYQPDHT